MIVSGISSVISPTTTANNIKDIPPFLSESANQPPLIYNDPDSGKEAIYACAWNYGSQMSVYYSDSFSKENPVFTVKIWDKDNGYVTQDIDGSKVDPTNATALELLAFGAYCDDRGYPEDATMCVGQMLAGADMDPVQYDAASSQIKHDFTVPLKEHMELTNHPAYMFYYVRYKAMYDFIKERPDINSINRIKLPYMERGYY